MPTSHSRPLACNFCGKTQHEVPVLIAGPTVYICNECVGLCAEIVAEKTMDAHERAEHDALLAALPYLERMDEQPLPPPMRSCDPKVVPAAKAVYRRLAELRGADKAPGPGGVVPLSPTT